MSQRPDVMNGFNDFINQVESAEGILPTGKIITNLLLTVIELLVYIASRVENLQEDD